jgi:hypothetical protein
VTNEAKSGVRRFWLRRLPPLSRIGWRLATVGSTRPVARTAFGIGLVGFGVVLRRRTRRKVLYRGYVAPGEGTHIKVYRGDRTIYDRPFGN